MFLLMQRFVSSLRIVYMRLKSLVTISLLFLFAAPSMAQFERKNITLPMAELNDPVYFKLKTVILSFERADLIQMSEELGYDATFETNDSLWFHPFIASLNDNGRPWTSNFHMMRSLYSLIQNGHMRIDDVQTGYRIRRVKYKRNKDHSGWGGTEYELYIGDELILEYYVPSIGCPSF